MLSANRRTTIHFAESSIGIHRGLLAWEGITSADDLSKAVLAWRVALD